MTIEQFLEEKLRKFSIVDFALVKSVYFFISLMVCSLYSTLLSISWVFYFTLTFLCLFPLWVHLFSQPGSYLTKAHGYLRTNDPAKQVLVFLSTFFFALMLGVLIPVIVSYTWWFYCIIAIVLAIKPLTVTWFW
jgi:hypothetical protein